MALKIGITGGIGSGKSIICKIFQVLKVPVYEADSRAKWLMNTNAELKDSIIKQFGTNSYDEHGMLNRIFIATQVFNDGKKVEILNKLVHPKVGQDFLNWVEVNQKEAYVINEAALMFESGNYKNLDKVITVFAPQKIRVKRVLSRDPQRTEQEILSIMSKQMAEEDKIQKADFIIYNDEVQAILPQVLSIHQKILAIA